MKIKNSGGIRITPILGTSVLVQLLTLVLLFFTQKNLPPLIPLYYGAPNGIQQLAQKQAIFIPTIFSLCATLVTVIISGNIKDSFLRSVFIYSSVFLTFLTEYTTLRIVLLVGYFH